MLMSRGTGGFWPSQGAEGLGLRGRLPEIWSSVLTPKIELIKNFSSALGEEKGEE